MDNKYHDSTIKVDHFDKCEGKALFVDDIKMDGMLYAKSFRSTLASAKIISFIIPELPKGYYVISHKDVVKENVVNMIFSDWPVFPVDHVNYIGEPILLVIGKDKEVIDEIIKSIQITYEEIKPVFGYVKSAVHKGFNKGDYASAKKNAKHIINETFETGYQEQAYLETQGMLAYLEDGDKVTLQGSMQCPYYIKNAVRRTLGYPEDKVRVIQPAVGGAFGGKEDFPSTIACQLATAVVKIKKPIKMILPREEDMVVTTKRHPSLIHLEAAVDENNHLSGLKINVSLNGGAYIGLSGVVLARSLIAVTNAYTVDNLEVSGDVFRTNTVPTGAFRGFGSPQTIFAIEMFMNHIAQDIKVDPLKFRLEHLVKQGDVTSTCGIFRDPIIMKDMINKALEMSDFVRKYNEYTNDNSYRGIGMSWFLHGCGFTGDGESAHIHAHVRLMKDKEGHVNIYAASVDMGQGNRTTLKRIVAKELGVPDKQVTFNAPDTDFAPDSGPTAASRTIMIVGFLLEKAAKKLKAGWIENEVVEINEHYVAPDYIKWDEAAMQGDAYPSYSWGVNVVEVSVSPITYQVDVKKVWSVFDVGRAIDERIIVGQCDGGVVQGLGYGYLESMNLVDGKVRQKSFTDYMIPTFEDAPHMEVKLLDNPFIYGPNGAKGAGELTLVGAAPAVALAIENAIHHKVNKIPATPEYIMELMNDEKD